MKFLACIVALAASCLCSTAGAVIIRDDRPDSLYREHGGDLASYCQLNAPDGAGVLVGPRWILTAAHLTGDLKLPQKVTCGRQEAVVVRVVNHPQWDGKKNDIALLELAADAVGLQPVELWRRPDEVGRTVNVIGHYQSGNGLTGADGKVALALRGATNRFESADAYWLRMQMDRPGTPGVTDLEGVSGPGDSGAPAWLREGERIFVLGVGSHSRDSNRDGKEPDYGDEDVFARVSSYAPWIDRVTRTAP